MPTTIDIRALAHGGAGVGEPNGGGPTWFVPGTLPGEVVTAEPEHEAKRHVRGRLVAIQHSSALRVIPPCPIADRCGGCGWQHIDPAAQPELKRDIVADQLRALVDRERVVLRYPERGAALVLGYRHRARMHWHRGASGLVLGFHASRSNEVVDAATCPVLEPALDRGFRRLRLVADALPEEGEVYGITDGRATVLGLPGVRPEPAILDALVPAIGDTLVGIDVRGGRKHAKVGDRVTLDIGAGGGLPPVRIGPFAFAQPQAAGNRALVRHVVAAARADGRRVLELYAGAGNFTRGLARTAQRVWASDTDREAVDALMNLARVHNLPINAKRSSAPSLLPKLAESGTQYEVVVVDPPRGGIGTETAAAVARVASERIVYVSCDPATLARDLQAMRAAFDIADVSVFDLVPMTPQVEIVVTLVRRA
jgi:23S rRNA (uracil1939-C5)-methyltransferase